MVASRDTMGVLFAGLIMSWVLVASAEEGDATPLPDGGLSIAGSGRFKAAPEVLTFGGSIRTTVDTLDAARDPHGAKVAEVQTVISRFTAQGLKLINAKYHLSSDAPRRFDTSPT